jgi:hypothetical protein
VVGWPDLVVALSKGSTRCAVSTTTFKPVWLLYQTANIPGILGLGSVSMAEMRPAWWRLMVLRCQFPGLINTTEAVQTTPFFFLWRKFRHQFQSTFNLKKVHRALIEHSVGEPSECPPTQKFLPCGSRRSYII